MMENLGNLCLAFASLLPFSFRSNSSPDQCNTDDNDKEKERECVNGTNDETPKFSVIALVSVFAAAAFATPTALFYAGFGPTGIVKGSIAAGWQSTMPLVAKGSTFAWLQSATMSGGFSMIKLQGIVGSLVGSIGVCSFGTGIQKSLNSVYSAVSNAIGMTKERARNVVRKEENDILNE